MARSRLISKVSRSRDEYTSSKFRQSGLLTFVHFDVHGPPPDVIFAGVLIDNTLIFRASASLLPGEVDERAGR